MNIVTVTLNPALDKTAVVDDLRPGELNRLKDVIVDAGGKGVNVSRMIAALGGASTASGFIGGGSGEEIARALTSAGIAHDFVRIGGTTRTNLKVLDRENRLTELNEPGAEISPDELATLRQRIGNMATPDTLFVFSGSVPRGVAPDIYAVLIREVRQRGARAYLDADGEAFRQALAAAPDFIKPNRHELLEYFQAGEATDLRGLAGMCRKFLGLGAGSIALSMGVDGALFIASGETLYAPGLSVPVRSSVGAGDSMVGAMAFAAARGLPWREAARLAMAASAGAVTTAGTRPPDRALVERLATQVVFETL